MFLYNVLEDIRIDTGEIVKGQKEGLKHDYKVNTNVMVGMLREKLMEIVLIKKYLIPIKPGRSFPRKECIV